MTDRGKPKDDKLNPRVAVVRAQYSSLVASARTAGVPPATDIPEPLEGLSEDERRILSLLLNRAEKARKQAKQAESSTDPAHGDRAAPPGAQATEAGGGQDAAEPELEREPSMGHSGNMSEPARTDAEEAARNTGGSRIPKVPGLGRVEPPKPMDLRLPNARVREDYSAVAGSPVLSILDDGGTGLAVDADGGLCGTPEKAGEFVLAIEIADQNGAPRPATAKLSVISNPKDLWVSKPSDRSAEHWKPDSDVLTLKSSEAFMAAGSQRGRSHAQSGGFREDDCALGLVRGWHLIVVADGAGSASMSRRASRLACKEAVRTLTQVLESEDGARLDSRIDAALYGLEADLDMIRREILYKTLAGAAFSASKALAAEAGETERPMRDYSTTILCAMARKTKEGWFIGTFSVGDGGAVVFDANSNHVEVMCSLDSGEYAGQTRFLEPAIFKDPKAVMTRIHAAIVPKFTALTLMTDGITDPFFPTDAALADPAAWRAFWFDELTANVTLQPDNAGIEGQMIDWLGFWSKGNHDDRTIAVLVPEAQA